MSDAAITVLITVVMLVTILAGWPVGWALGGVGIVFGVAVVGPGILGAMLERFFWFVSNTGFQSVPFFVFMGIVLQRTGVADNLFRGLEHWFGGLRGGIAIATVGLGMIMGAASGIIGASVVTLGLLALPAMLERGYNKSLAVGVIAASGTLGIIIPPSVLVIIYAVLANVSVGRLFFAAAGPGIMLGVLYIIFLLIWGRIKPGDMPAPPPEEQVGVTWGTKIADLRHILPVLVLILSVLGSIFFGIATPPEAASFGGAAALGLAVIYRRLTLPNLRAALLEAARLAGMFFTIGLGANFFVGAFNLLGGAGVISNAIYAMPGGALVGLYTIFAAVFITGFIMSEVALFFIIGPILSLLLPTLGFDQIWVGAVIMVIAQTSFLTPPYAFAIFYLRGLNIPGLTVAIMYKGMVPFVGLQLIGMLITYFWKDLSLWLPNQMFGVSRQ